MKHIFFFIATLLLYHNSVAQLKLPTLFADHMMLQQQTSAKIWGKGTPQKKVQILTSWNDRSYATTCDRNGNWSIHVQTPKAGGPYMIEIKQKITIRNILIGEIWLCSGQSNMDMPLKGYYGQPVANSSELLLGAPNNQIRLFRVERQYSNSPMYDVKGNWLEAESASVAKFSAVAYQFAKYLQAHLDVPVGIIQSTWGGSPIEAWMAPESVDQTLAGQNRSSRALSDQTHQQVGNLYHGMIHPLTGFQMAGVIWYQGEQNRFNYYDYLKLQNTLVTSWRNTWAIGQWPFYYVEIAPMQYPSRDAALLPLFREQQFKAQGSIINSGMVTSIDVGEKHNIHPRQKTVIAQRLAAWALGDHYKKKEIVYKTPTWDKMIIKTDTAFITFKNIPMGLTKYGDILTQFEIAGADQIFYPAHATLRNNKVEVWAREVQAPAAVRYAFKDWCYGELFSTEGIPVASFRTDTWP